MLKYLQRLNFQYTNQQAMSFWALYIFYPAILCIYWSYLFQITILRRHQKWFVLLVTINLKLECLKPGKKIFERTKQCLAKLEKFTVILKWEPPNASPAICPSTIAKYFSDLNYDISYSNLTYEINTLYSLNVPNVNFDSYSEDDIIAFSEWLGMVSVNGEMEGGSPDNYLSTYEVPEPNRMSDQIKILQWRGLFSQEQLRSFFNDLGTFLETEEDWIAIYVQGFSDSVVSWHNQEHHYYTSGDSGYLIVFNKKNYIVCTYGCSKKKYK